MAVEWGVPMELITEDIGEITIVTLLAEELDAGNAK